MECLPHESEGFLQETRMIKASHEIKNRLLDNHERRHKSERGSIFHSERGSTVIEYVLGIALLFPVALGIGLSLEAVSQSRGQVALEASQYLLPCTSSNSPLGKADPEECK